METDRFSSSYIPTSEEVESYLALWQTLPDYKAHEDALDRLFLARPSTYMDESDLLLKCSCLNDFYSTNIFKVYYVVQHYMQFDLAGRLAAGDLTLVESLRRVPVNDNGTTKDFYSFATKFCSHHCPDKFPIYDRYVDHMLHHFSKKDGRFSFNDLKDYVNFVQAVDAFRIAYGLQQYSYKQIDQYLWQYGKEYEWRHYLVGFCKYYKGEEECPAGCRSKEWWELERKFVQEYTHHEGQALFARFTASHLDAYKNGRRKELWAAAKKPREAAMVVYAVEELAGKWYPNEGEDAVLTY